MKIETLKIRVTFTQPTLATAPGNKEIMEEFKASKAPTATAAMEELSTLPMEEQVEKASTVFHCDERGVFAYDYQWRGFFKEKLFALIELGDCSLSKWSYKKAVDLFLFIGPRRIHFTRDGQVIAKPDGDLQRSLRATTMQGDRIALARSQMIEAGAQMEFDIKLLMPEGIKGPKKSSAALTVDDVKACLDYGAMIGFSQWRGGGYGTFTYEILP